MLLTARSASVSGRVKPIELSDDAWKIVETDSRSASTAENVRAAMPWTPDHALAGDRDDRLVADDGQRLHRVGLERPARRDFGAGRVGVQERAHVHLDARAGDRDERARVQHLRAVVRDLARLAMVQLRNQARVGHEPWVGGQDARARPSTARRAGRSSARASSVADRSVPPRPIVVTLPSGARPMNPGTTTIVPAARRGSSSLRARRPCVGEIRAPLRRDARRFRRPRARRRRRRAGRRGSRAAVRICADMRSPRETRRSLARGSRWSSRPMAAQSSRYSRAATSMVASSLRRGRARPAAAPAPRRDDGGGTSPTAARSRRAAPRGRGARLRAAGR